MMKRRTRANKEKNLEQESEDQESEASTDTQEKVSQQEWTDFLSHEGNWRSQIIGQLSLIQKSLDRIAEAEEKRNEIAEEEYSDEDESDEED